MRTKGAGLAIVIAMTISGPVAAQSGPCAEGFATGAAREAGVAGYTSELTDLRRRLPNVPRGNPGRVDGETPSNGDTYVLDRGRTEAGIPDPAPSLEAQFSPSFRLRRVSVPLPARGGADQEEVGDTTHAVPESLRGRDRRGNGRNGDPCPASAGPED